MLTPFLNPDDLNAELSPAFRIASALLLAAGAAITGIIAYDTIRHWSASPHPALFLIFLGAVAGLAIFVAARLVTNRRIARPVAAPARPAIMRVMGLVLFVFCALVALASDTFVERELIGGLAIVGFARFLWPRAAA